MLFRVLFCVWSGMLGYGFLDVVSVLGFFCEVVVCFGLGFSGLLVHDSLWKIILELHKVFIVLLWGGKESILRCVSGWVFAPSLLFVLSLFSDHKLYKRTRVHALILSM